MNMKDLNILYWNARSLSRWREELEQILKEVDLLICVQTWLKEDQKVNFAGFNIFRNDRTASRGGGILILIRKNLGYCEIKNIRIPHDSIELCGISINNIYPPINVFGIYRTPGINLIQEHWDTVFTSVADFNNCIFVRDFNAHHLVWN